MAKFYCPCRKDCIFGEKCKREFDETETPDIQYIIEYKDGCYYDKNSVCQSCVSNCKTPGCLISCSSFFSDQNYPWQVKSGKDASSA